MKGNAIEGFFALIKTNLKNHTGIIPIRIHSLTRGAFKVQHEPLDSDFCSSSHHPSLFHEM